MSSESIVALYNQASAYIGGHTLEIVSTYSSEASYVALAVLMGYAGGRWKDKRKKSKSLQAVLDQNLEDDYAAIEITSYVPTGGINPKTGQEFCRQVTMTMDPRFNVRKVFGQQTHLEMMGCLEKAKRHCTDVEPLIFQHLETVVPKKQWEKVRSLLMTQWKTSLKGILTDTPSTVRKHASLELREVEVLESVIPVLVYEQGAQGKDEKIVLVFPNKKGGMFLPSKKNVLFDDPCDEVRFDTNKAIQEALLNKSLKWVAKTTVQVPTGKTVEIPEIVLPPEPVDVANDDNPDATHQDCSL